MSEQSHFDVLVLGGGPGGYTAAFRAADLGLSVCLVEKRAQLGGVCLNVGCIPSKTLLHAATIIEEAQEAAEFGIDFDTPRIDLEQLRTKKAQVIDQLTSGLAQLAKARKVKVINGTGSFKDQNSVVIASDQDELTESAISFDHAIVATGSRPFALPFAPSDDPRIWNSTDALALNSVPKRLLIIGGGIIGLEMAQVYYALGSEITIVEMENQIIPPADKDLVQPLFLKLKKRYTIHTNTKVTAITANKNHISVEIEAKKETSTQEFDSVLVAVGRRPNSESIGLEIAGVKISERGFITTDERQRTSISHIFAIGDVVGDPMLAHKATHQAKVAAEVIAGHKSAFSPLTIPSVAYTNPEVAWMGLTEKEAKEQGIEYDKGKFSWGASGRALTSGVASGATKALFDRTTDRIIGAGICGANAGELIHEAILALEMGADAEDIAKTIHAHPTLAETFAFAAEIVDGSITDGMPAKKK